MDMMDHRARSFGGMGSNSRIILLGDGTEIDTSEADMFDHDDEDHDLEHQVNKGVSSDEEDEGSFAEEIRKQREGTPGPTGPVQSEAATEAGKTPPVTASPSSITTEKSEGAEGKVEAAPLSSQATEATETKKA